MSHWQQQSAQNCHVLTFYQDDNGVGSCRNPKRNDDFATSPTEFFAPCTYHGGAFTYPRADANTLYNGCPSERYVCCIGHGDECMSYNNNPRK